MEESGGHSRRRRRRRRRPPAPPMEDGAVWRDPITQEKLRFGAGESGLSRRRPRRSGTRSQSQASSSAAPPVDGGGADPDPPARPQPHRGNGFMPWDPDDRDGSFWGPFTAGEIQQYTRTQGRQRPGNRSQASSSAAPRSDGPGGEGRTRVRQSVLYSDRHRYSRPRRLACAEEHPGVVSSSELGRVVADLPTLEALSLSDPAVLTPQTADAEETTDEEVPPEPVGFGFLGPQTLRYSARSPNPKWSGGVRGQAMLEEHASDASSSELDPLVTDSSRSEAPPVTVSSSSRSEKPTEDPDDDTEEQLRLLEEYFAANPPTSFSQCFDKYRIYHHAALTSLAAEWGIELPPLQPLPPRRQFLADQAEEEASPAVAHPQHSTVPRKPSHPGAEGGTCVRQCSLFRPAQAVSTQKTNAMAEEHPGVVSSSELGRVVADLPTLEALSLSDPAVLTPQTADAEEITDEEVGEASTEEIVENAKKWMHDEVTVVFQNYVGRRDDLKIVDYRVDKLCHQCVSVENYHKIVHHYNFTVKLKKANSDDWIGALYFAEVKQMFGRKSYFCCLLEPNENGLCYACQNQGVDDLRHPATGGFDVGFPDVGFSLWYPDEC